jgi:hypothetical protein
MRDAYALLSAVCWTTAATALVTLPASAQQACGDTVCDLGWTCETYEEPCPDCDEEADCGECRPATTSYCALADCESDADCASYMVCAQLSRTACPEGFSSPCIPGETDQQCADRAEAEQKDHCTEVNYQQCSFRWTQPCEAAEDCGEGFECLASGACQILDDACTGDTDCPEAWQCEAIVTGSCGVDQGMTEEECDQALEEEGSWLTEMRCFPPALTGIGGATHAVVTPSAADVGSGQPAASNEDSSQPVASDRDETESSSVTTPDEGGCSLSRAPVPAGRGRLALVMGLALAAGLVRRRLARSG